MPKQATDMYPAEKLSTFALQLHESAQTLEAAVLQMQQHGTQEIEAPVAIILGMEKVDGFCTAVRKAIRSKGPKKKTKGRVRIADTESEK